MDKQKKREYLISKVNPIIEQLVIDILKQEPENIQMFIYNQMKKQINPDNLQQEISVVDSTVKNDLIDNRQKEIASNEDIFKSDSDQDEEVDDVDEIINNSQKNTGKMRQSISAEVFGQFNQKKEFIPLIIEKQIETYTRIQLRLQQSFMFSYLDAKDQDIVIKAMEERFFKQGDQIIKEGDDGDVMFLVDQGELDCFKIINDEQKLVKNYVSGESFGELALLYNAPRAATIIAKSDCVLFQLDRETFNNIVKDSQQKRRDQHQKFIQKVELLQEVDEYERQQISDSLITVHLKMGQYVFKQGDFGDDIYFIEEGECQAMQIIEPGQPEQIIYEYKPNDYFGELALLKQQVRAASILAKTDLKLQKLDRQSFIRLIGPLSDILKRNLSRYEKFKQ